MKKNIALSSASLIILAVACSGPATESTPQATESTAVATSAAKNIPQTNASTLYSNFLKTYVTDRDGINFVAYGKVTPEHHAELKTYIASLESQGVEGLNDDEIKAYWFNVYNAKTIDIIVENRIILLNLSVRLAL